MSRGTDESRPRFVEAQQEFEKTHGTPRALKATYFGTYGSTVGESALPYAHAHLDHGTAAVRVPKVRCQVGAQVGVWWGTEDGRKVVDAVFKPGRVGLDGSLAWGPRGRHRKETVLQAVERALGKGVVDVWQLRPLPQGRAWKTAGRV